MFDTKKDLPQPALYRSSFEHDNCGIGAIVDMKGRKTHKTVSDALSIVENLEHRAGKDAEGKTGDGVGILLQISHKFFVKACREAGIVLPKEREYGVGMFFFPQDELKRNQSKKMFEIIVRKGRTSHFPGMACGSDRTGCTRTKSNRLYAIYYAGIRQETGRDRKGH